VSVWREPAEESVDLYPGLVVHDSRVSGSITTGRSRLPLWAFVSTAITHGWDEVEAGWSPTENYGFTEDDLASFLYRLLEQRGELGRLLLILADVERIEGEMDDKAMEGHGPVVLVTPGDPNAVQLPGPWWRIPELRERVVDQLRRCLNALESTS